MTDGASPSHGRIGWRWLPVAGAGLLAVIIAIAFVLTDGSPTSSAPSTDPVSPPTPSSVDDRGPRVPEAVSVTVADPGDVVDTDPPSPTLPPRDTDVHADPQALATRFLSEWLTYPPGPESAADLAARLGDLLTPAYRTIVEGLSTAGTEARPGAVAALGTATRLDPIGEPSTLVFRVAAWQAHYAPDVGVTGPDAWDVSLVHDPTAGWRVDGLRRVG
jgi:hypothetical protein